MPLQSPLHMGADLTSGASINIVSLTLIITAFDGKNKSNTDRSFLHRKFHQLVEEVSE